MTPAVHYDIQDGHAILRPPVPVPWHGTPRFRWSRKGSYAWVSRAEGAVEAPFLSELEPSAEDYFPPPRLHLAFARLANRPPTRMLPAMQRFCETFGPLGVAQMIPPDPRLARWGGFFPQARKYTLPSLGEPFGVWW
ncbi:MAG: hypothetical protein AB1758_32195, partial [Candidatus Eremiobacterota bacterium]